MSEDVGTPEERQWLDVTMPKIADSMGASEKGMRYVLSNVKQRFLSDIYFVRMSYTSKMSKRSETRLLVIKRTKNCIFLVVSYQFHNENLFYQMFYQPGENFPRYVYSYDSSLHGGESSVIVLEDMSSRGFKDSPTLFDIPYNYVLAVLRELGRFHAKGYVLKKKDPAKFQSIVDAIKEDRFHDMHKDNFAFHNITTKRAVNYLRAQNYDASFCDKMEALFSNVRDNVVIPIVMVNESSEPLATICHGDATTGNMLFRPLSDGSVDVMLIDFGMIRYGTPVVDLSTFFCLTCTNDTMRDKLDDMLAVYHKALTHYMSLEGVADTEKYSYEAIYNDYKEGCLYGYYIASFYLTVVLGYFDPLEVMDMDLEKRVCLTVESGGDKVSAMLAEMLLHMTKIGSLKRFL